MYIYMYIYIYIYIYVLVRRGGWVTDAARVAHRHVEYAELRKKCGILFMFGLLCEYSNLEYVRVYVIYRVTQAECVNSYSCGCLPGIRHGDPDGISAAPLR